MAVTNLWNDVRYALRQFRKSPGFTLTAVAVLALGIGANIAVFTILNGILLRSLPYAQPDRVMKVEFSGGRPYYRMSYANMRQLHDAMGSRFQMGASFGDSNASIIGPGGRLQVNQIEIESSLLTVLGVHPALGRAFRDEENEPGHNRVVLLGDDVWRKLYASDSQIVGKTITIKGQPFTIIGVMPRSFSFPFGDPMEIWSPAALNVASRSTMSGSSAIGCDLYARLPEGMSGAQLSAALNHAQAVISKELPSFDDVPTHIMVAGYQQALNDFLRKPILLLYAVVFGIWALACLNVTSLMLAHTVARSREQAVRAALGASRGRSATHSSWEKDDFPTCKSSASSGT